MTTFISSEAFWYFKKIYGKQKVGKENNKSINLSTTMKFFYIYVFCSQTDRNGQNIYGIDAHSSEKSS